MGTLRHERKRDTMIAEEKKMKTPILLILFAFLLSSCNGWVFQPIPGPTPFLPPTPTPRVHTATPVAIGVSSATPAIATGTNTLSITNTSASNATHTAVFTLAPTWTASPSGPSITIHVLGCITSVDVTHGMG